MPPEIVSGENTNADPAIDVWALGCMTFAMLIGHLPFYGDTPEEFEDMIVNAKPRFNEKGCPAISEEA